MAEYLDVEFTANDTLTELQMDQMSDNDTVILGEAVIKTILTADCMMQGYHEGALTLEFLIDGISKASFSGSGAKAQGDISLTDLTVGLHLFTVRLTRGDDLQSTDFRLYRTQEMGYMTLWALLTSSSISALKDSDDVSYTFTKARGISVITHRETLYLV